MVKPIIRSPFYNNNENLKAARTPVEMTPYQVAEFAKCVKDPIYFTHNYAKIVSLDSGIIPFNLYDFQEDLIEKICDNRFVLALWSRQIGKSTTVAITLLWHALFNKNWNIAVLAHKEEQAQEVLHRIKTAFELLPSWMQQGVVKWNERSIAFENGSRIFSAATTGGSIRGKSLNMVMLDEFSHLEPNLQEEFFTGVFPTITSGKDTKMIITTTPKGMDMFYKLWKDSEKGKNSWVRSKATWDLVPGRTVEFKDEMIRNSSPRQFAQEHDVDFLGSSTTLIDGKKIDLIVENEPIGLLENDCLAIFEKAIPKHKYVMCVDTSHGVELDFSSFVVIDATEVPYRVVARYRSNVIPSIFYPEVIYRVAKTYNNAFILVESNDVGGQVANTLYRDLEYEHMFVTQNKPSKGQEAGGGWGTGITIGLRMTPASKRIGCMSIKTVIEMDRLTINDFLIKQEMSVFVADNKKSYSAEKGKHDDLMMCLVMFGWLVHQPYFKELTEVDIRRDLIQENTSLVNEDLTPFGFIDNGDDMHGSYLDDDDMMKYF